ncbi:class I SAM-dependent methyltransferase, partial [Candidatus Roizmanbacteria bacterium]|nr:class I SAM-dependent methyltransferase [Candidatus Roizmanbacteria bacterium]
KEDGLFLSENIIKNKIYGKAYFENNPHPAQSNKNYFLEKIETIRRLTKKSKPYILDVGCGWGEFEEGLEKETIPYLGIDTNNEAIEICKKKGLNCQHITLEKLALNQKDGNFDAVTLFQVIEHIKDPLRLLSVARKLLRKDGMLLITTPNNDSPLRKIMGKRWSVYNEPSHFVFYNKKTLERLLKKAEFNNIKVKNDSWRFLSSKYIFKRLRQVGFPTFPLSLFPFNVPIPTDPFGDLETTGFVI